MRRNLQLHRFVVTLLFCVAITACGGGGSNSSSQTPPPDPPPPPPPPPTLDAQYLVSSASPFAANCDGVPALGALYVNAEVEPHVVADPGNPQRLHGAWQQDRWSSGGARGIVVGVSEDAGRTWSRQVPVLSRCAGGNAANGAGYERSSDPWVTVSPDGTVHVIVIAFSGGLLTPGSLSSVLVSRSRDQGRTWSPARTLVLEGGDVFHDKQTITADPNDSRFVYAVWDRVSLANFGPTWFARSVDGGDTWEPARPIYDPGVNRQTIGNVIVVLPNGTLVNVYSRIDAVDSPNFAAYVDLIRSTDNGLTWSAPIRIASQLTVGTVDPETGVRVRDGSLVPTVAVGPGGVLYVAWQDSRFSGGARDGIAISKSEDGGLSWTPPARVNRIPSAAAFVPALHVRGDGMIGLSYYDLRNNTADRNTLPTTLWLAQSTDAVNWSESQVTAAFDLVTSPLGATYNTSGYFLGDYQGLASSADVFIPFYARTNGGSQGNRSDIFAAPAVSATTSAAAMASELRARGAPRTVEVAPFPLSSEVAERISRNIEGKMKIRKPGEGSRE